MAKKKCNYSYLVSFFCSAKPLISGHLSSVSSWTTKQDPFNLKDHATLIILCYWESTLSVVPKSDIALILKVYHNTVDGF